MWAQNPYLLWKGALLRGHMPDPLGQLFVPTRCNHYHAPEASCRQRRGSSVITTITVAKCHSNAQMTLGY